MKKTRLSNCPECGRPVTLPAAVEEGRLVRCPLCDGEFPLVEAMAGAEDGPPELVPLDAAAEAGTRFGLNLGESVSDVPEIDVGTRGTVDDARGTFNGVKVGDETESPDGSPPGPPRERRKEKSLFRELVGIVLGGIAGLFLAYYGLNLFGGQKFDIAKIYLPGVRHTVEHRPAWWPIGSASRATRGEMKDER